MGPANRSLIKKEIGSDYEINPAIVLSKKRYPLSHHPIFLSTGMDCLQAIIRALDLGKGHAALLPSYLCHSILIPFKDNNLKCHFYKLDQNLCVDLEDFENKIKYNKFGVALVINYFGFVQPAGKEIRRICGAHKVLLIEDQVQSCLTQRIAYGDFTFNSYRKIIPTPDGAYLTGVSAAALKTNYSLLHEAFVMTRLIAGIMKSLVMVGNGKNMGFALLRRTYWKLFMFAEVKLSLMYPKPAKASFVSRAILRHTDFEEIFRKRRENYAFLAQRISSIPKVSVFHQTLPSDVCPIGLPVRCEGRDNIQNILNENKIFPPVHWRLPSDISKDEFKLSHEISESILTLPIDQRYGHEDLERVAEVLATAV